MRLTDWILRHRRVVLLGWLLIALVGIGTAGRATKALSHDFSLPGHASTIANDRILRTYGSGGDDQPLVPVVTLPPGVTVESPGVRAEWSAALAKVGRAVPGGRVSSYVDTRDRGFVAKDGRTTFALFYAPYRPGSEHAGQVALPKVRSALKGATVHGAPVHLTGQAALADAGSSGGGPGVLVETLAGLLGALVVLVVVFGSGLAVLPLVIAAASIPTTFLLTWAITSITPVSFIVQYLVALIGLGVAIDYALIVVMRWREETDRGLSTQDAVRVAMRTAGSSVVFSGTTVAVGLAALIALPVPFLRSVGYAGLLIPLVSVVVALTLLPVLLTTVGPRLDRRRLRWARRSTGSSRAWVRWTGFVVRHRWAAALAGLAVTGALLGVAFTMRLGDAPVSSLPATGSAGAGLSALQDSGISTGVLSPTEVVTSADSFAVADRLGGLDGVRAAISPPGWRHGGSALVEVLPSHDASTAAAKATVEAIRHTVPERTVGGTPVATAEFIRAVYGSFPLMVTLIALVTFLLLARAFRSIVLPLKALALNVLSIGAAWGVLVLVWQHGFGSDALWSVRATGAITPWVPLMVFAFLFGLSMDYEVFLLSRIREQHDTGDRTDDAITTGLGHTGRLVTYAAVILVLAFVSLSTVPDIDVKMLATGLGTGILLDATVVRALLVPALLSLLGKANWWLPSRRRNPEPVPVKIGV